MFWLQEMGDNYSGKVLDTPYKTIADARKSAVNLILKASSSKRNAIRVLKSNVKPKLEKYNNFDRKRTILDNLESIVGGVYIVLDLDGINRTPKAHFRWVPVNYISPYTTVSGNIVYRLNRDGTLGKREV